MIYKISTGEKEFEVNTGDSAGIKGEINGSAYTLDLLKNGERLHIIKDHGSYTVSMVRMDHDLGTYRVMVNNREYELTARDRFDLLLEELGMGDLVGSAINDLKAPMPGLVLDIPVAEGQEVSKGEPLVVLEAMKMENVLKAETDAKVKSVNVSKGEAVEKNHVLVEFEA